MSGWNKANLEDVFATYRDALPDREASAGFMPELWRRIEQRRRPSFALGRFARGFVTASLALCLGMVAVTWSTPSKSANNFTYVDVLEGEPQDVDTIHGETL